MISHFVPCGKTAVGSNVDWISLSGIYGSSFQIEMKCVAFVKWLSSTKQKVRDSSQHLTLFDAFM